ncbi:MAG TPA: CTP synthase, partial [Clostridiales bacterium]|nr:CTP synthase [Clostridiales bacterium]
SEMPLDQQIRQKIALYCNISAECVIPNLDVDSVYQLPLMLEEEGLAREACRKLGLKQMNDPDLSDWQLLMLKHRASMQKITVALVGKYVSLHDAYLSVLEALKHAGIEKGTEVEIRWVSAEELETGNPAGCLDGADAIIIPGGFGPRGMNGMVVAAGYARTRRIPFLGIGLGMQMAVVEFARQAAGLADAHSEEAETACTPIFAMPVSPEILSGKNCGHPVGEDKPMRRGSCNCVIIEGTRLARAHRQPVIAERHHHRREFCNEFRKPLTDSGLVISGLSPDRQLVEAIEVADHSWFVGVQYHPEFKSRPTRPHPLFIAFVEAALDQHQKQTTIQAPEEVKT